jgi:hypothetical protein
VNVLKDFVKSILIEGALERETTEISRVIVDRLKTKLEKDGGFKRQFKFSIPAPQWIEARAVIVDVRRGSAWSIPEVHASYLHDDENLDKNEIRIMIELPKSWSDLERAEKQLSLLVPELKLYIRHELEHSVQSADLLGNLADPGEGIDFELYREYIMHPAEVAARVTSYYKLAKMTKRSLDSIFIEQLQQIKEKLKRDTSASQDELKDLTASLYELWVSYAESRFPAAQL